MPCRFIRVPLSRRSRTLTVRGTGLTALLAVGALLAACGNIGLDATSDMGASPAGPFSFADADAGAILDAASSDSGPAEPDAGAPLRSNALCNWTSGDASTCYPDDEATCTARADDAGADGGALDGGRDAGGRVGCHMVSTGGKTTPACGPAGAGGDGTACQTSSDCAPSFDCVGSPGRCRAYCCDGDRGCATGAFCDIQTTSSTGDPAHYDVKVPVCVPVSGCKLLTPRQCQTGETCAVVKDDGTTSCVTIGPALDGQGCDDVHCGEGLTCLGKPGARQCYRLCHLGATADCATGLKCKGSAQLFGDPTIGICQ